MPIYGLGTTRVVGWSGALLQGKFFGRLACIFGSASFDFVFISFV
jgi:hypothetical protein